jgi:purine nucleosidase
LATPCSEANIHNDARAASEVLAAPWRCLRVVGLDATHRVRIPAHQLAVLQQAGPIARWLWRACQPYLGFYTQCYGAPLLVAHDAIALMAWLEPALFEWRQGPIRVVENGFAHGQTLQDWQGLGDATWHSMAPHRIAIDVDADAVAALCLKAWLRR